MEWLWNNYKFVIIYIAVISLVSVFVTVRDKIAAIRGARRTSERTLLFLSALGGSLFMLLTMLTVRHKTKHAKFMVGIPIIIALQTFAVLFLAVKGYLI